MKVVTKLTLGSIVLKDETNYYLKREGKITEVAPSLIIELLVLEKEANEKYINYAEKIDETLMAL